MNCGVYMITCIPTGKKYIGSSIDIANRFSTHRTSLKRRDGVNQHLQSAWKRYGESAFVFDVLEHCQDRQTAIERENYWIDALGSKNRNLGFNKKILAESNLGLKRTASSRRKQSETRKKRNANLTPIERFILKAKWSEIGKKSAGKKYPPEFGIMTGMLAAKLTPAQRLDICNQYYEGCTQTALGKFYGVTQSCIWQVVKRKQRPHLYVVADSTQEKNP